MIFSSLNSCANLLFVAVLFSGLQLSGQSKFVPIRLRDESQQRQFVKDFLADGAPAGRSSWRGELLERAGDVASLVHYEVWAEDAVVEEVERLDRELPRPDAILRRLGHLLVESASDRAFETIRKRYRDDPHFELLIKLCIYRNLDTRHSQPFGVIYRALESQEAIIRDPAGVHVRGLFEYSLQKPYIEEFWAKALLRRYGHEPTDLEILIDPVAEEIRLANPGLSLSTIPRVRALAKRAAAKR